MLGPSWAILYSCLKHVQPSGEAAEWEDICTQGGKCGHETGACPGHSSIPGGGAWGPSGLPQCQTVGVRRLLGTQRVTRESPSSLPVSQHPVRSLLFASVTAFTTLSMVIGWDFLPRLESKFLTGRSSPLSVPRQPRTVPGTGRDPCVLAGWRASCPVLPLWVGVMHSSSWGALGMED